jgi:hypothetical protein
MESVPIGIMEWWNSGLEAVGVRHKAQGVSRKRLPPLTLGTLAHFRHFVIGQ